MINNKKKINIALVGLGYWGPKYELYPLSAQLIKYL